MQDEPGGLLSDSSILGKLVTADSVLAIYEQPDRHQPFVQPNGRIFENGSDLDGKFTSLMMTTALPCAARWIESADFYRSANWADRAIRPTAGRKVLDAVIL